jgi:hypothetical protein
MTTIPFAMDYSEHRDIFWHAIVVCHRSLALLVRIKRMQRDVDGCQQLDVRRLDQTDRSGAIAHVDDQRAPAMTQQLLK